MFILDPVNAVTSIQFYKKVAAQSFQRSVVYLLYLASLFTVAALVFTWLRIVPPFTELMEWMAQKVPPITFGDGKVTSATDTPYIVRHPSFPDFGVMIDTTRTDPVTPQMMEESKVRVYVTGNAMYLINRPGRVEVNDLSKTQGPPMQLGPQFFREFAKIFPIVLYAFMAALAFMGFLIWRTLATLLYWLIASLLNTSMGAGLGPEALASIAVYGQTLPVLLFIILLFSPAGLPGMTMLTAGLVITTGYMALAIGAARKEPVPPSAD
ncbi:MAG: DUF1189 family protein [Elusimicrobia bacterium]|nr:DUF1189 family protein [Elusimicrobiota bacterium]